MNKNPFGMLRNVRERKVSNLKVAKEYEHVLIDPSLLLSKRTFKNITQRVREGEKVGVKYYLPASFQQWLFSDGITNSSREEAFFLGRAEGVGVDRVRQFVEEMGNTLEIFRVDKEQKEENIELRNQLNATVGEGIVSNILYEEWIFLMNHSWIIARTKKGFQKLINAGGVCIEVGEKLINKLVDKTLRDNKEERKRIEYFRAYAKWIAVSGTPMIALVEPVSGVIASSAAGVFLLFDPS